MNGHDAEMVGTVEAYAYDADNQDPASRIRALCLIRWIAADAMRDEIRRARRGDEALSWSEIGQLIGVSKQAAQQRYGLQL